MPPPDSHRKPLSDEERNAIRQWILDGAKWGKHWSFEKLTRPNVPSGYEHPIDAFVVERLKREGLTLSRSANGRTLLRRLSLDLYYTGLKDQAKVIDADGEEQTIRLGRDYTGIIQVKIPAEGMSWYVIENLIGERNSRFEN